MKQELKDRLKQAMEARHMKAVDLCAKTGIPKGAISYYMAGKSEPRQDRIYLISKALDINEAWLLGYDVGMDRDEGQKINDAVAEVIKKIKKEKEFRDVVLMLNKLNSKQFDAIKNMISAFPHD